MGSLRNVIFIVIAVVVAKNLLVWVANQLGASLQEYVTRDIRNALYAHLEHLPLSYFMRTKTGQILSRVITDTAETRLILTQIVTQSLQSGALVLSYIAFLFLISWRMALIALILLPMLGLALQPLLTKLRKGNRRRGNQHGEMTSVVQETVSGIRLVKSFGAEALRGEALPPGERPLRDEHGPGDASGTARPARDGDSRHGDGCPAALDRRA